MPETLEKGARIFVAGHRGLVGSNIVTLLRELGYSHVVTKTREELNLLNQESVHRFFEKQRIDYAFIAAAKVGGILCNNLYQADFLYENVTIASNIIHAAAQSNVKKLLFLGSSCIYPRQAPQPIREEYLLTGPLEPTNEGYALAKIVGLKLCEKYRSQYQKNFISAMPTNLYGPGDNFHPQHSHVIPGLFQKFHRAQREGEKSVTIWGTGTPRREFLHVRDLAEALVLLMEKYEDAGCINVGTGQDITIRELASLIAEVVGFTGEILSDTSKPDGTPRKVLDISKMKRLGWSPRIPLLQGLRETYAWALRNGVFEEKSKETKIYEIGEEAPQGTLSSTAFTSKGG
jgi:GDP-L-fucose synthase